MASRKALLVGATGLVGRHCLRALLEEPAYARVTVLGRRPLEQPLDQPLDQAAHAKLETVVVDFDRLADRAEMVRGDDVYCCLGTTLAAAGSREAFRKVDHDYVVEVARLARAGGATRFALVSSVGANIGSSNFYLRVKAETEREVAAVGYERLEILRPSFLVGERTERRVGEAVGGILSRVMSGALVGSLRKYRPIDAESVARAMVHALVNGEPGQHVRSFDEIRSLSA